MKRNINLLFAIFLSLLMLTSIEASAQIVVDLEWKVEVGDSITMTCEKYYDSSDWDENGDPNSYETVFGDKDGNVHNITVKKGLKYKIEIISLQEYATVQMTVDGHVSEPMEDDYNSYVRKTVDNKSYLEEEAKRLQEESTNEEYSVEGDFLVTRSEYTSSFSDQTQESVRKLNWKTGWWSYQSQKSWNSSGTISEMIMSTGGGGGGLICVPGFEFVPLVMSMIVFVIFVSKKRIK